MHNMEKYFIQNVINDCNIFIKITKQLNPTILHFFQEITALIKDMNALATIQ